jgi:hypothetical protein
MQTNGILIALNRNIQLIIDIQMFMHIGHVISLIKKLLWLNSKYE